MVARKIQVKEKSITTIEIEVALAKYFDVTKNIIIPNLSWGLQWMHEIDIAVISKSGYLSEVEIKISKADFLKDFEKKHHHIDYQNRIAYFYYAMPESLYEKVKDEIPENAGIIVCVNKNDKIYTRLIRKPKRIKNCRKLTDDEQFKVAKLGCMRIFRLKTKIIALQKK